MRIPVATGAGREYFRSLLPADPAVEVKPMFGNSGAFVHGNMFAGLFGPDAGARLAEDARAEPAAMEGAGPFGPEGRPMGGYLSLPAGWRAMPSARAGWVERAFAYVASLPAVEKKARASRKQV